MDETKAIGYVRVSTDEQHLGPDAQEAAIREFAARSKIDVVAVFADSDYSGTLPIEKRPGLSSALESAELAGVGRLIIARWDRLARDAEYSKFLFRLFGKSGVTILSADGLGNGEGPNERFVRGMMGEFAEFEGAMIGARTRVALAVKKARGERVGQLPYGWTCDEKGVLVPVPAEQEVIRLISTLRRDGRSFRWIAAVLNERGIPARPRTKKGVPAGAGEPGKWHAANLWTLHMREAK